MDLVDRLAPFGPLDSLGVLLLVLCWAGATWIIEHPPASRPSTSVLVARHRRRWMEHYVRRTVRIFDSQIITLLRQGSAFFASASMIAIGGGFALLGNAERLRGVAQDLTEAQDPVVVFEVKIVLTLAFAANAFLKFVWSHRLFGYVAVLMAAVPDDPDHPQAADTARRAGELNVLAARSYNRGLRAVYFGIASGAWLAGPLVLMAITLFTLGVILRREFASQSRETLIEPE